MTGNADGLSATPSKFGGYPNYPVEQVSWDNIQVFLSRFGETFQLVGLMCYRLKPSGNMPAVRVVTDYSWGDDINASQANYGDSNNNRPLNVGQYAPNPWGFFDMHGNVWEWTVTGTGHISLPTRWLIP